MMFLYQHGYDHEFILILNSSFSTFLSIIVVKLLKVNGFSIIKNEKNYYIMNKLIGYLLETLKASL